MKQPDGGAARAGVDPAALDEITVAETMLHKLGETLGLTE
jgi:hypothetical protein